VPLSRHWEAVIKPLLRASDARSVVEVGVAEGATTVKLLELAAECGFVVHGIDPAPSEKLDVDALVRDSDGRFVVHPELSLEALPRIRDPDVVLIDGDHNWYTVYHELATLARVAKEEQRQFPLAILHDVDWPYGRRDLYYDPDSVPEEQRQPYARGGVVPWSRRLAEEGGFGVGMAHALVEGTPRNGVRTALDDFLAEVDFEVRRRDVPGFHGVAVIVPAGRLEANPVLAARIEELGSAEFLAEQGRRIERARARQQVMIANLRAQQGGATES
jgi:hypothetical protein